MPATGTRTTRLVTKTPDAEHEVAWLPLDQVRAHPSNQRIYGEPVPEASGLLESIRERGILVPLVVATGQPAGTWELLSGHRRLACARELGLAEVPCVLRDLPAGAARERAIIDYNCQRDKTFSQRMREADALHELVAEAARGRRLENLRRGCESARVEADLAERRNSDARAGRTDSQVARVVGLGGKDMFRQARAVWKAAQAGDPRASAAVVELDAGRKTIHAAYKDLRRRDRFAAGFRPTPYDVWAFRHDPAFGVPHPGAIPAAIIAHAVHYFSPPGGLVVDPMAGGGTTLDVCQAMGRRCLAYDLEPVRSGISLHDVRVPWPEATSGCDLVFCDPPYHTLRAGRYGSRAGVGEAALTDWVAFLQEFSRLAFLQLGWGGHVALLLANQSERDLPAGYGYLDHVFYGYMALQQAGFQPVRRMSCPMSGGYTPQQVRLARLEGRVLGLVRDLLVMRKPRPDEVRTLPLVPPAMVGRTED